MVENGVNGITTKKPQEPSVNGGDTAGPVKANAKTGATGASQLELERCLLCQLSAQTLSSTRAPGAVGEVWSLVSANWMRAWRRYVNSRGCEEDGEMDEAESLGHPGPIDNSSILVSQPELNGSVNGSTSSSGRLRPHLLDGVDYSRLAPEAWQQLLGWYGLAPGQVPVLRPARQLGRLSRRLDIEPYPLRLRLAAWDRPNEQTVREFSRTDSLSDVSKEAVRLLKLAKRPFRLWLYDDAAKDAANLRPLPTAADACHRLDQLVFDDQCLLLEVQDASGCWKGKLSAGDASALKSIPPPPLPPPSWHQSQQQKVLQQKQQNSQILQQQASPYLPGVCGLANLGNSCFMNSALQALSNVQMLTDYFLSNKWKSELNTDNPLGMRGEVAAGYGRLISDMWSGRYSSISPRQFKQTLGRFAPQFSGFQQQDSQELMAFLLDGLHEDLNRVRAKPYVEVKDANGRPDQVVATEAWRDYKLRNDSAIVDLFHGQLKSTLVCPDPGCAKISVTFDPFCYLSLPLPTDRSKQLIYHLVRSDPNLPIIRAKLVLPYEGRISQLCSEIARQMKLKSADRLLVADVYKNRFYGVFSHEEYYNSINCGRDVIYVYELDAPIYSPDHTVVKVFFNTTADRLDNCFGLPVVFSAPHEGLTYERLVEMVTKKASKLLSIRNERGEFPVWWDPTDNDEASDCQPPPLFILRRTNTNLSSEVQIPDSLFNSDSLSKPRDLYLAARFSPEAKRACCNESAVLQYERHESLQASASNANRRTLSDCLKLFTAEEQLGKKDAWHCPKCKKFQCATKKFDIWALPKVLVVHLKRFQFDRICRNKIDNVIEFPLTGLDMGAWAINPQPQAPATYSLVSVANHFGGLGGGHYTAYGLNCRDQRWYEFDDSIVSPADPRSVVSGAAYLLVYVRSDLVHRSGESVELDRLTLAPADPDDHADNNGKQSSDSSCTSDSDEEEDLMDVS
ncbi:hypothetical protein BOX15_Mlig007643g1 [Macrostomum lignano]|uniref:Ubiquitin carboxyl-terminal hydrolase n=1 Tax=Macrostomum lignano TaxID=282301 RepID=A0A267GSV1_9PLAT|nr:hypothetical protein BOX15_Mlig007643g1 [Macrostomum lignano]